VAGPDALCAIAGVKTTELAMLLRAQVKKLQPGLAEGHFVGAMCLFAELRPQTATEALLAVQMAGVHNAATAFLAEAVRDNQINDQTDANVLRATRLMRLFTEQLEAMAKLKGTAGRQRVTVEHVHVHAGGQAIVGAVTAGPSSKAT
jgi:hypothetical protein